jgi:hypothetical protein
MPHQVAIPRISPSNTSYPGVQSKGVVKPGLPPVESWQTSSGVHSEHSDEEEIYTPRQTAVGDAVAAGEARALIAPWAAVAAGQGDPFGTYPAAVRHRDQALVHHCKCLHAS